MTSATEKLRVSLAGVTGKGHGGGGITLEIITEPLLVCSGDGQVHVRKKLHMMIAINEQTKKRNENMTCSEANFPADTIKSS